MAESLNFFWGIPFLGVLLSLSLGPLLWPKIWRYHSGKVLSIWSLGLLAGLILRFEISEVWSHFIHVIFREYVPFIIFLGTLYIVSGGLWIQAKFQGSPFKNTCLLGLGTLSAGIIGTTGAVVILIKPLLQANKRRLFRSHLVFFLIILVGNVGGILTPLGDPPLFLGYLEGIDFMWIPKNVMGPFLSLTGPLLFFFYVTDRFFWRREMSQLHPYVKEKLTFDVQGKVNFFLLGSMILLLLSFPSWKHLGGMAIFKVFFPFGDLLRETGFLTIAFLSWCATPQKCRHANAFTWNPLKEVGEVFLSIFITLMPLLLILESHEKGGGQFLNIISNGGNVSPLLYFWVTGGLSAFLDNVPTYLIFLKGTGLSIEALMTSHSEILLAISCGAVFMGALTYIGNAPNFIAKSMAEEQGVEMPGFFKYMLGVCVILLPLLILMSLFFLT